MVKFQKNLPFLLTYICIVCMCIGGIAIPANVYAEQKTDALQQQKTLRGNVTDEAGPVIGATVSVVGKATGTITDENGNFTLSNLVNGDVIRITYLGHATNEIVYSGQASVNVKMTEDTKVLDEVVVTALGIKRDARALGYATSTIKGEDMVKAGVPANPLSVLYGKAAGVGIQSTVAGPMGGVQIRVRGAASLNPDQKIRPLFVVDGVPIYDAESTMANSTYDPLHSFDYGSGINDINPEDIESMEILKGAKASVLYGSEGANGVVLITTKSGSKAKSRMGITVSYGHEWEQPYSLINFQNEYGSGTNEYDIAFSSSGQRKVNSSELNFGPKFNGDPIQFFDGSIYPYQAIENNFMDLFRGGSSNNTSVALAGGNETGNARLSYTRYQYDGIMPNQQQQKNSISFNSSLKISDYVSFDFIENLYLIKSQNRRQNLEQLTAFGAFNRDYDIKRALNAYKDENGYMKTKTQFTADGWPEAYTNGYGGFFDMLWNQNENRNIDKKMHSISSARVNLQLLSYLSLKVQGGLDYTSTDLDRKDKVQRFNTEKGRWEGGLFRHSVEKTMIQNYDAFLTFDKDFMGKDLHVNAFAGPSYKRMDYEKTGVGTMGNFIYPDYYNLANTDGWPGSYDGRIANYEKKGEALYSVLGQAVFDWQNKYYVEISARNDWASTLPKANRSYFYPGVSFTWNFTEDFTVPSLNYGKFRLSWANVGRPAPIYYALRSYSSSTVPLPWPVGINDVTGPTSLFSGDLKPERKREIETGFDLRFFQRDRLGIDFSYYNNTVYNQIMAVPLSSATGSSEIKINAGEVNNQGLEFMLKVKPLIASHYQWDLSFNIAKQWDKINKLYPGIAQLNLTERGTDIINRNEEGQPMGELWMRDYLRDEKGNKIVNAQGLYQISPSNNDLIRVGNINPDFFGGINSNFSVNGNWGAANFSFGIDYRVGGSIVSLTNYYLKGNGLIESSLPYRDTEHGGMTYTDAQGRARHDGLILPGVKADGKQNDIIVSAYEYYSSYRHTMGNNFQPDEIKENNYVKFREIALGYTFPQRWTQKMKIQKLSLSLTARNLFYIYKSIDNIDPESTLGTSSWTEYSNYPSSRTYGFNVNIAF